MPEKKIKHLEMIESVIERMARNSFQLKGWTMTLVSAIIALFAKDADHRFIIFATLPVIGFWLLDSFYLQQERKFRLLYKNIVAKDENDIDFSMDISMANGTVEEMKRLCFCRCLFSASEIWFYWIIAVAVIVLIIVINIW